MSIRKMGKRFQGFTLIELMVTITLIGIFAAMALPALGDIAARHRVKSSARNMASAFSFARQEAVRQNVPVMVCPAEIRVDGKVNGCQANGDWTEGTLVFADRDGNRAYSANEQIRLSLNKQNITVNMNVMSFALAINNNPTHLFVFYPNGNFGQASANAATNAGLGRNNVVIRYSLTDSTANTAQRERRSSVLYMDSSGRAKVCERMDRQGDSSSFLRTMCTYTAA